MFRNSSERLRRKQLIEHFHIARRVCRRRGNRCRDAFNACDARNCRNACKTCDNRNCRNACKTCDNRDDPNIDRHDARKTCDDPNTDRHDTSAGQGGYSACSHEHTRKPGLRHQ
jgi:hypothetical protein